MRRRRNAKIVATLGPASATEEMIHSLFFSGVDVFRLNFSHGTHEQHRERLQQIRNVERDVGRPISPMVRSRLPQVRRSVSTSPTSQATPCARICRIRKSSPR